MSDLKEIKLTPKLNGGAFSLLTMKCTSAILADDLLLAVNC
jgi:hypothetical protein